MGSGGSVVEDATAATAAPSLAAVVQRLWRSAAEEGALEAALGDMAKQVDDPQVQQLGCFVLAGLTAGEEEDVLVAEQRHRAVKAGALEALCGAGRRFPDEVVLQRQCLLALSHLAHHRTRAAEAGAINVALAALLPRESPQHPRRADAALAEPGVRILQQLVELSPERRVRAIEAGLIEALALNMAVLSADLQEVAVDLLASSLSDGWPGADERATQAGALEALVFAMRGALPGRFRVLRRAATALGLVGAVDRSVEAGALEALVDALTATKRGDVAEHRALQFHCCSALGLLGRPWAERATEAGALEALIEAMRDAPGDPELLQVAFGALGVLCAGSNDTDSRVGRAERAVQAGALDPLLTALASKTATAAAAGALGVLCCSCAARAAEAGASSALAVAMRHGPQDLTLQQRACGALGRLADVDGADLEAEAVKALVEALRLHSADQQVQEYASYALWKQLRKEHGGAWPLDLPRAQAQVIELLEASLAFYRGKEQHEGVAQLIKQLREGCVIPDAQTVLNAEEVDPVADA
ncbi:unnamed protein product [Durusdinium trenchii]|uniref:Protein unc-45 homolog B n=1 Tax=Durusdinium trenchii TaxID=1381693 RepID=A0ABP0R7T3_9DINO